MKQRLEAFFAGRQGMDELSKLLFWTGVVCFVLAVLVGGGLGSLLLSFSMMGIVFSFVRALSRNLPMREAENLLLLRWLDKKKRAFRAWQERFRDRKEYKYFKCPACGQWLRVPRHKGKIHINCRCGYTLYRRT